MQFAAAFDDVIETDVVFKSAPNLCHQQPPFCSLPWLVSSLDPPTVVLRCSCTAHTFHFPTSPLASSHSEHSKHTNKRGSAGVSFSSLLSSKAAALGEYLVLASEQKRRRKDALPWHVCAAAVPRARGRKGKRGARGRNNDDKDTRGNGGGSTHQGRSMPSLFPEKRRGGTEERTVEKQPKVTGEGLAVRSSSSCAIYLLSVVFVRTCSEEARRFCSSFQSSKDPPARRRRPDALCGHGTLRNTGVWRSAEKNTGSVRSIKGG